MGVDGTRASRQSQRQQTTLVTRLGAVPEWALTAAGRASLLVARTTRRRTAAALSIPMSTARPARAPHAKGLR